MTVPTLPDGLEPLQAYLGGLERRIGLLEAPQQPGALFPIASNKLTTANAKTYVNCTVYVTDLTMTAFSNGAHWYRSDTGAQIV